MAPITIQDVRVILTQPDTQRLVIVKVITSEPGLYGLGCATFTQRFHAVAAAVEKHLKPFLIGRDVTRSEEIFRMSMVHADGRDPQEVEANVRAFMAQGYRYIRVQMGGYGGKGKSFPRPDGAPDGAYYDPRAYTRDMLKMIEHVRGAVGAEVELLHDIHERLAPIDAVQFARDVEPLRLFFLEDALAPEDIGWFEQMRGLCATPLAMGELFNSPHEWQPLISRRLIDFIRMHVSQMGGITPARAVTLFADMCGVRTAWHGPGDTSPVGHAANLHLDLWAPNFGIQEWWRFPELVYEVFPGTPEVRDGYMYPNDRPGLGIDVNEALAAKYPCRDEVEFWT